jgi:hypothetical protein
LFTHTKAATTFSIAVVLLLAALAACAWAIFTSGAVTHGDAPPPVLVPDSLVPAILDTTPADSTNLDTLDTIPTEEPEPEGV